jgi:sister-chromatid-cohesion protein PDS5
MVAQTRAGNSAPKRLAFNEKIVGKGLATDALLKKLKALHTELAELDQELVDVNSLSAVRTQLVNTSILLHKDRGVKAYAACCLADILRLYAPDAPYTHTELRDIFQFFFRQLATGLRGADASYYNEYFHLLESLSTVKSVVLVCDLPHAEELMVDIFRDFFGLVRRDLAKKIEIFIADILVALIDECQALPSEVLETIMAQFMANDAVITRLPASFLLSLILHFLSNLHIALLFKFVIPPQTSSSGTSVNISRTSSLRTPMNQTQSPTSKRFGRPTN